MLYSIQAYLEDYLNSQNLRDPDGYAVHLANLYIHHRSEMTADEFAHEAKRIRTVIFVNNRIKDRAEFERMLIDRLDKKFLRSILKKKRVETTRNLLKVQS